jgi:hypothetical protein
MRWPGIEPGSTTWKAAMLTIIPPTLLALRKKTNRLTQCRTRAVANANTRSDI